MASKYQMQAKSSADGQLYSWLAVAPDWSAVGYSTAGYPGAALDVTLTGGGLDTTGGGGGGGGGGTALTDESGATLTDESGAVITDG